MNIFAIDTAKKFDEEIVHKCGLIKCLNTSYTKALGYIDNQNYDALLREFDIQNNLLTETAGSDSIESGDTFDYEDVQGKVISYLSYCGEGDELYPSLVKITVDIKIYKKLIKNCKILNEKLIYQVKEKMAESERHILALKSRKLIQSGYKTYYSPEKGSFINCKSN
jgi:hypothetical protein